MTKNGIVEINLNGIVVTIRSLRRIFGKRNNKITVYRWYGTIYEKVVCSDDIIASEIGANKDDLIAMTDELMLTKEEILKFEEVAPYE